MPELQLIYCRHMGAFNQIGHAYEKLFKWAIPRGLVTPETKTVTVYRDDPAITSIEKVRQDASIIVTTDVKVEGEIGKAICEKYFPTENWERAYSLKTGIIKRISQYTGLNFREVLELPYSFYLLLNRESWIASYQSSEAGREILKNLWRLQQTEADEVAIHKFAEGRRKWQEA